jgi:FixJ family two-component response regulator
MSGAANKNGNTVQNEFTNAFLAKPFQAETLLSVVRDTIDTAVLPEASHAQNGQQP